MSLLSLSAAVGSVFVMSKKSFDGGGGIQEEAAKSRCKKSGASSGTPFVALLLSFLAFVAFAAALMAVFSNFDWRPPRPLTRRGCAEDGGGLRLRFSWPDGSPPT